MKAAKTILFLEEERKFFTECKFKVIAALAEGKSSFRNAEGFDQMSVDRYAEKVSLINDLIDYLSSKMILTDDKVESKRTSSWTLD